MTERQKKILELIVSSYIEDGEAVGSKNLIKKYNLNFSSATIRNEMFDLEKNNFLEKSHASSGRIPSIKGYKYYAQYQANKENKYITKKIIKIFKDRKESIENTLDKAIKTISEISGLTLVSSTNRKEQFMKSIHLTPINQNMGTIVIVTSDGNVNSKIIYFNDKVKIDDVRIAIRLFKERLIDSKLKDLPEKTKALAPLLSENINNCENIIQTFVRNIFNFQITKNKVYGNSNLIKKTEIKREDLIKLIDLISNKSIWETIETDVDDEKNIKIDIRENNTSLMSKQISFDNNIKEISVIGSNRMKYSEAKQALSLLEKFLKNSK